MAEEILARFGGLTIKKSNRSLPENARTAVWARLGDLEIWCESGARVALEDGVLLLSCDCVDVDHVDFQEKYLPEGTYEVQGQVGSEENEWEFQDE